MAKIEQDKKSNENLLLDQNEKTCQEVAMWKDRYGLLDNQF